MGSFSFFDWKSIGHISRFFPFPRKKQSLSSQSKKLQFLKLQICSSLQSSKLSANQIPNSFYFCFLKMKRGNSNQSISRKKSSKNSRKIVAEETRNWLDLHRDIWIQIFIKLGTFYVLHIAQNVCSLWREISKEPQIFCHVDIPNDRYFFGRFDYSVKYFEITREALNRCRIGELVKLSMEYFCKDELLELAIAKSRSSLRCLRLANTYDISEKVVIKIAIANPMLEVIDLSLCYFDSKTIEAVGRACQQLKCFRMTSMIRKRHGEEDLNKEAYAIANSMPGLRRLDLLGNRMDNKGLQAILDKCTHLEYLDLRRCFRIGKKGNLLKKCSDKIQNLKLPNDCVNDYEFQVGDVYGYPFDY